MILGTTRLLSRSTSFVLRSMSSAALTSSFPASTASPSRLFRFPGTSPASTAIVRELLTENDRAFDIFMRARYAHNHFAHSILTRYALGGSPELLRDTWEKDKRGLVSLDPSERGGKIPEEIKGENWDNPQWLSNTAAYSAYLAFFHREIDRLGPIETLRTYIFSPAANWQGRQAMMLARIHGGAIHPFIHMGFGLEFQDKVSLAEGLAEACVSSFYLQNGLFDPDSLRDICTSNPGPSTAVEDPLATWQPLPDQSASSAEVARGKGLLEICSDLTHTSSSGRAQAIREAIAAWLSDPADLGGSRLQGKLKEFAILATLFTCSVGEVGGEGTIDFFAMHTLTSSLFVPSYLPYLSPAERRGLLYTYVCTCVSIALRRGLNINSEYVMEHTEYPTAPGSLPSRTGQAISDGTNANTQNAWMGIISSSLFALDSHVPKAIRSLVYHSSLHGHQPLGFDGLKGAEQLDGTIFIRAAGIIMNRMGWCREGQKEGDWDM